MQFTSDPPECAGAVPGDGVDDAPCFEALEALAGDGGVIEIGPGAWEVYGGPKWGWRIDHGVTVAMQHDTELHGDGSGTYPSKDLLSLQPDPARTGHVQGVVIEGGALYFDQPATGNPQGHAINLYSAIAGRWVLDTVVRDVHIHDVGNGDGIYVGLRSEGVTIEHVQVEDFARSALTLRCGPVAGAADCFDYRVYDLVAIDDEPEARTVVRSEPPAGVSLWGVELARVHAPAMSANLSSLTESRVDDLWASYVQASAVDGIVINDWKAECRTGSGADGAGYCYAGVLPPQVVTFQGLDAWVDPAGQGVLYVREPTASTPDHEDRYRIRAEGDAWLNGGVLVRPDLNADAFDVDVREVRVTP